MLGSEVAYRIAHRIAFAYVFASQADGRWPCKHAGRALAGVNAPDGTKCHGYPASGYKAARCI